MMPQLAISIINYRTGDMTIAAVQSVLDDLGDRAAHVAIVDNASGDGSAEQIADWLAGLQDSRVELVRSTTNSGFSGGHNQGMAAAPDADFYLILNSDAVLRPGFFDAMLATAQADPKVGLTAPRLEWDDGTPQISTFRFASPLSELDRGAATGPVSRLLRRYIVALSTDPDPKDIRWASFACILLRGDMVRALGPMDEGYFLYFEDEEYSLRAYRAGWRVRYEPAAQAVHYRGGSGPVKELQATKKRLPDYLYRSRTRFLRQAYGPLGPLLGNLCWITGRAIAHLRILTGRRPTPAHEREWSDIWTNFLTPLKPDTRR
jgi:GT2 family glycosyltransferase